MLVRNTKKLLNQTKFKWKIKLAEYSNNIKKARVIAYYLPQFHPIPENDEWWGKGFTEWTNVGKAKPLFRGHYQPRVPADLGYYDLRVPEVREAQAQMAKDAGVEGFAYWHYWWAGKRLLERPINEVLKSGNPDFPFCLSWANETWSGIWIGSPGRVLIEQAYPGKEDYEKHFYAIEEVLHDKRYIQVDGKPLFVIYRPLQIPDANEFIDLWNKLAMKSGFTGVYFVGIATVSSQITEIFGRGFDAVNSVGTYDAQDAIDGRLMNKFKVNVIEKIGGLFLNKYNYSEIVKHIFSKYDTLENVYPTIIPQWDNSPRSGRRSLIYTDSTPGIFENHVKEAVDLIKNKTEEHRILFLKSWNEWAEGNYIEPDIKYGFGYLNALKKIIQQQ